MLFYSLKIFHVISAALFLTSIVYSIRFWHKSSDPAIISDRIQTQTWLIIVPFALLQLMTGFTMISLQHYKFSELWIKGSVAGFVVVIVGWFAFAYFLLSAQQSAHKQLFFRRIQLIALSICTIALLSMIYFMANKIT